MWHSSRNFGLFCTRALKGFQRRKAEMEMSLRRRTISLLNVKEHPMCVPLETFHLIRKHIFRYFRLPFPHPPHFSLFSLPKTSKRCPFLDLHSPLLPMIKWLRNTWMIPWKMPLLCTLYPVVSPGWMKVSSSHEKQKVVRIKRFQAFLLYIRIFKKPAWLNLSSSQEKLSQT